MLAFGGFYRCADETDWLAVLVFDDGVVDVGDEGVSVFAADREGSFPGAGAAHGVHDVVSELLIVWSDGEFGDRPPEHFGACPAVEALGGAVPVGHATSEVGRDDGLRAGVELIFEVGENL
jgi:hypothetical protein